MPVKNIIVINDFDYTQGGASKVAIDTANLLAEKGFNCVFFSVVHSETSSLATSVKKVTLNQKEFLKSNNKIVGALKGLRNYDVEQKLNELLDGFSNVDTIVHVHGWTKACSSVVFRVLKKRKFKTVLTLHDYFAYCPNGGMYNFNTRKACNLKPCSLQCIATNCDSRNYFFKVYRLVRQFVYRCDMDSHYINYIFVSEFLKNKFYHNFKIEYKSYKVLTNPCSFSCSKKDKVYDFVYVGRTDKEKGIDLYVKLAKTLLQYKFLIVGNQLPGSLQQNVVATGWVSEDDVEEYLSMSRCLVLPSLWPETYGLNVFKAKKMGLQCIVSSNTGAADIVDNNDIVFEQGNFEDLLEKVKCDSESYMQVDITDGFYSNHDDYIEKLTSFYDEVLNT
ncbi:MAG: glycosyltransferase [Phascolarctobacterium sp.]|nr:glycosyltransferase [Phascolarctobacterium sp.]